MKSIGSAQESLLLFVFHCAHNPVTAFLVAKKPQCVVTPVTIPAHHVHNGPPVFDVQPPMKPARTSLTIKN
jgi:hypothetical protein